jgi:hypothetical protein
LIATIGQNTHQGMARDHGGSLRAAKATARCVGEIRARIATLARPHDFAGHCR